MKRTMSMAIIIGLFATAASAASVTSENTVGYNTASNGAGAWTIKGVPFSVVGDENVPLTIEEALDGSFSVGDKVYAFNGTGYDIFVYSDDLFDPSVPGFVGPGWGDASGGVTDLSLTTGQAIWVNTQAATTYNTAGQVRESQFTLTTTAGTFALISNPYPADTDLNDAAMTGLTAGDKVYVYNGSGYDIFVYSTNLFDPSVPGFVGPGWGDASGGVTDTTLSLGEGFWIETASSAQIDFPTVL